MPHPSPDPAPYWFPFRDGVRRFVARRVPPPDVDDVVQDVLLRLLTSPPPASAEAHVERWIFGIARRTVADFYRRLLWRLAPCDQLRLMVAVLDGRDIGYVVGGIRGSTYRGLQMAYDRDHAHIGVGHLAAECEK